MGDYSWSSSQRKGCLVLLNASFLITTTVFLTIQTYPPKFFALDALKPPSSDLDCHAFQHLPDSQAKCLSLKSRNPCVSQGYIDYLHIFYCSFGESPFLGHLLLLLWLLVLFYLLGNTASHYFCSSLEDLSRLLKLSPTIAGVTLLSLGNGAPDVFASFVSFAGSGTRDIGFNTMVGGASFVTCVVVGTISFLVKHRRIRVSRAAFVRDVCFFLLVLGSLIMTIFVGEVNLWGAIGYSLIRSDPCSLMIYIAEMPLYLPRRLTIPVFSERDWSKPMAITSVILAPILLSTLWIAQYHSPSIQTFILVYGIGWLVGVTLGVVAYLTTEESSPPEKCLLPWVAGGFLMSVTWSYITAQELVALLVSMGYIFGISPSILGLTVLAWGNSLSDLITNSTMALNGGPEGVQVAISGCYAGPIFNILFGLGLSLVGSCWQSYPDPVLISSDPYLLETLGFLVASLVWALVVLPRRRMKLDGVLGGGLLLIYLMSVSLRLIQSSGSLVL
ncbi:Cation/calcium exchanger 1 [Linum perenne]